MRVLILALFASLAASGFAQATSGSETEDLITTDRPGIANGSALKRPGEIQIEAAYQGQRVSGDRNTVVPFLLRFGATDRFEVRLETGAFVAVQDGTTGYAPHSLGAKYGLGANRCLIGRVFVPSGGGGFGSDRFQGDLLYATDVALSGGYGLTLNVGGAFYDSGEATYGTGLAAATLSYGPNARTSLFADAGFQTSEGTGRTALTLDAGIAYIVGRDVQLDLSVGNGVTGFTTPRPFVAAGLSYRFRPKR